MAEEKAKSIDQATIEMLEKAAKDGVNTAFDRAETMKPCPIGSEGSCCSMCSMGFYQYPHLASGLDGVRFLHAFEAVGDVFQRSQPLEVAFQRFAPCAGPGAADGIGRRGDVAPDAGVAGLKVVLGDSLEDL